MVLISGAEAKYDDNGVPKELPAPLREPMPMPGAPVAAA